MIGSFVCAIVTFRMDLLGGDSDSDVNFTINKDYAQKYEKWRQGEELQKLKDRYGKNSGTDSSSSEDEDENARELTKDIEKDFFRTLSCLKVKDPKIYDHSIKFFKNQPLKEDKYSKRKEKKDSFYSLGEYQRKLLIEKGGQLSDEDNENFSRKITNAEEEQALKNSFKDIFKDSESENDDSDWGGLFKKRIKTKKELDAEEEDYKLWLSGEKKKLKNLEEEKELKGLHDFWADPGLDENEQFLRDYILNKRFLEKGEREKIPSYEEVVHDSDSGLSADENTLQQQEEFERKYNFRFEEPDQEFIKRYPRTLEHSMRKRDEKRKRRRDEVKARKEAEKAKKAEELKRLKALKRKEIIDKIKKLEEITGNEEMGFQAVNINTTTTTLAITPRQKTLSIEERRLSLCSSTDDPDNCLVGETSGMASKTNDLEGDFDPEDYDRRMSEIFNEDYYGACEDQEKPECPELDNEFEIENWDEWVPEEEELHCEDPGFNMDCDYDPKSNIHSEKEFVELSKKRKKRRQSKFCAAVAREKPLFDPKNKSFEKYIDEYYALDYEDLIGDLPCRFKYRKTIPNDFGLSIEEILSAPDKELNSWISIKKIMQRRPEHVELYDVKAYKKKAKDFNKKKKCLPSLYGPVGEPSDLIEVIKSKNKPQNNVQKEPSKISRTKTDLKKNSVFSGTTKTKGKKKGNNLLVPNNSSFKSSNKIQKKNLKSNCLVKKKENEKCEASVFNIPDSRLKSYGINPKKLKNKLKWKQQENFLNKF